MSLDNDFHSASVLKEIKYSSRNLQKVPEVVFPALHLFNLYISSLINEVRNC